MIHPSITYSHSTSPEGRRPGEHYMISWGKKKEHSLWKPDNCLCYELGEAIWRP